MHVLTESGTFAGATCSDRARVAVSQDRPLHGGGRQCPLGLLPSSALMCHTGARQRPSHATRGPCPGAAGGRASPRRRGPSLSGTRGGPWPSVLASGAIDRLGVGLDADAGRCVRPARHMRRPAGCLGARGGRRDRLLAPACVLALVSLKPRLYYVASTSAFKNPCHIAYMRIDHLSPLLEQDRVQTK